MSETVQGGSQQRLDGRADDTETTREERRWWVVHYRHTTKAPAWYRLRVVDNPKEVDTLVAFWVAKGCDVKVVEAVEVVTRTVTLGQPEISSPIAKLCNSLEAARSPGEEGSEPR